MNKQPVSFLQTDKRWAALDYSAPGERTTIGASGCGPTAMAMVAATWAEPSVTPKSECAWALAHGYKAPRQGTYYGYFTPAARRWGLSCVQLNGTSLYGKEDSPLHSQVKAAVEKGALAIACMGPGNWTRSGHFVLVWGYEGGRVLINDPASTKDSRTRGSYALFRQQVKYYFLISAPAQPSGAEQEDSMDTEQLLALITDEAAYRLLQKAETYAKTLPEPDWSRAQGHWDRAVQAGLIDGTAPERAMKRDEVIAVLGRAELL